MQQGKSFDSADFITLADKTAKCAFLIVIIVLLVLLSPFSLFYLLANSCIKTFFKKLRVKSMCYSTVVTFIVGDARLADSVITASKEIYILSYKCTRLLSFS